MFFILLLIILVQSHTNVCASRFVSLKSSEINLRVGPGKEYPIGWIFMKAGLPVLLLTEFEQWRKIKFVDGIEGWVHQNMISAKRTGIIVNHLAILYKNASMSYPIAKLEKGVIVKIIKKEKSFIKIEVNKVRGWIEEKEIWGTDSDTSNEAQSKSI